MAAIVVVKGHGDSAYGSDAKNDADDSKPVMGVLLALQKDD